MMRIRQSAYVISISSLAALNKTVGMVTGPLVLYIGEIKGYLKSSKSDKC